MDQMFFNDIPKTETDTKVDETAQVKVDDSATPSGEDGARQTGKVVRWSHRGFGFIAPKDGTEDVFCHFSALKEGNALVEGSEVEFTKVFDEVKSKYFAEDVMGGVTVCSPSRLLFLLIITQNTFYTYSYNYTGG